jgi:hypothetical protein
VLSSGYRAMITLLHSLFLQLNYYSREAAFSSEKLVFNKTNFAATNVVSFD